MMSVPLERLATAWAVYQGLVIEAMPFLLIGVTIASIARWLNPGGAWLQRLPSHPLGGPLTGAALGFALPACECGNVPVARRLLAGGAPLATALGFLFAAPVLNPIVLASTWAAFPDRPWLLLARPAGALVISLVLASLLRLLPESELLTPALLEERRLSQP
ncbi:MAG: permease, partial [Prochlorococcaceae cyanobacterium]